MYKRPNIVIVMTDQQRADLRRSCGYELDTMPFLDRWAEGGVDFARAYTPNPTCMPARVSMFTGRYSQSHRVRTNHNAEDALYTEDLLDVLKRRAIPRLCLERITVTESLRILTGRSFSDIWAMRERKIQRLRRENLRIF